MIKTLYPIFQKWSQDGSVYLISDTHFGDLDMNWRLEFIPGIQKVDIPPEITEDEVAQALSEILVWQINQFVHKQDTLIILGDVGDVSYIKKLKAGYKVLIKGNHDTGNSNYKEYFDEIYDFMPISDKIMLSHEPLPGPWLNLHGHVHDLDYFDSDRELTLCCEKIGFSPISLADIIKSGKLKNIDSIHRVTINNAIERKAWNKVDKST